MCGNSRFLSIRGLGKSVFRVFCSAETSESFFFAISAHPRPRKASFWQFLLIRGVGKSVFRDFCSSETSESFFLAISAHPRPRIGCFS